MTDNSPRIMRIIATYALLGAIAVFVIGIRSAWAPPAGDYGGGPNGNGGWNESTNGGGSDDRGGGRVLNRNETVRFGHNGRPAGVRNEGPGNTGCCGNQATHDNANNDSKARGW